jgi:two-component system, sensor histidine kinase and response regulator
MGQANILVVDDTPDNIRLLAQMLTTQGHMVRATNSGKRALEAARSAPPDLVLLDIMMPEMDGFEVCEILKSEPELRDIPVIFISALDNTKHKMRGFEVGGVDYITKPFQMREVLARVNIHLELVRQRRQIEALRRAETEYLKQLIELKDDVLRIASHDLKNPLTVIMGNAEIMSLELESYPEIAPVFQPQVQRILESTKRATRLVRDLLDIARLEGKIEVALERGKLAIFLANGLDEYYYAAGQKHIKFIYTSPPSDLEVYLAPERFNQIIANLLSNAIKYTPEHGQVELSAAAYSDDEVAICVKDNGIGIPATALPHLFDKFYRVPDPQHQSQTGSGLGLAIVKTIVERHNGRIEVISEAGAGSTFTVYLKRADKEKNDEKAVEEPAETYAGR